MPASVAQNQPRVCGRFDEKPIVAGAAETMNLQCAGLELLKICGEASRMLRSKADEIDRRAHAYSRAWAAHRDSIATHERKALA